MRQRRARAPAYSVGIDLGTTHTVVAFAPATGPADAATVQLFAIEQLVAPGEVDERVLLPSMRYHTAADEFAAGDLTLPWTADSGAGDAPVIVGELARVLGAQVPGRLVTSAKSWLSHAAVDRQAAILPWAAAADVTKVSPVAASASYLAHLRAAWNHRHPEAPLEAQEIVLTVPASFDDAARTLTLQAARDAGLPELRLLEEPQAALYDWLWRHRATLAADLGESRLVLVCDVGGGTTDLSLVRVEPDGAQPRFERVAVGRHLMLGGDNMDLAIAHQVEAALAGSGAPARLGAGRLAQLIERCRAVKETLLADGAPASASVTLLGSGSKLIGGARSVELQRDTVQAGVLDGFFPHVPGDAQPMRGRASALVSFGLPYASDPAVTRHIAAFLQQHADHGWPDALLLNGGVFRAGAIVQRLHAVLAAWRGAPLHRLENADPDTAVARGAVAHALARRGQAPTIAAGSARSYFLQLDAGPADAGARPAVCLLPHGSQPGEEVRLEGRAFALRTGTPVRFHLAATTGGGIDPAHNRAGALVDLRRIDAEPLPPIATVIRDAAGDNRAGAQAREIAVGLVAQLTEVGTLDVACIAADDPARRWRLEFQLRKGDDSTGAAATLPPQFDAAVSAIESVFGARDRSAGPKLVKQLRARLEALLGQREQWTTALLRPLFDELQKRARGRRRSADHERLWLSLAGWCLRPGYGDPLDGWRIDGLWPLFEQGVQHGHDAQVCAEWWTLWRRVAGGLDEARQMRLLQDFAFNLRGSEAGLTERPPRLVKGGWDDMLRVGASLERIASEHKVEIGEWLIERVKHPKGGDPARIDAWTLWAIGRIGTRLPLYGSAHEVVPVATVVEWVDALLLLDWKRVEGAAAAASNLARLSGDRSRDLPPEACDRVAARLQAIGAPPSWIARVREVVVLNEADERSVYGDTLPPGLKLLA